MDDSDCRRNPVYVSRDAVYSKIKLISPENRKEARERVLNLILSRVNIG